MRNSTIILICLGILALVASVAPGLGVLPAITVIGLPIAIAYWALPAVFVVYLISYLLFRFLPFGGMAGVIVSLVIALILLAVPPFLVNGKIERIASSYVAGDQDNLVQPIKAKTIAVRHNARGVRRDDKYTQCDGFCLHALLTGTASRVIIHQTSAPHEPLDINAEGIEYRLERRASCPEVEFNSGRSEFRLPEKTSGGKRTPKATELMKLRISDGECLVADPAPLSKADIIISRGSALLDEHKSSSTKGFDLSASTVKAQRFTVHVKNGGSASFTEQFRLTEVLYKPLFPILLPAPEFYAEFRMSMGWARRSSKKNIYDKYYQKPDWPGFLTKTLGFDLELKNENIDNRVDEKIAAAINENRNPTVQEWQLIDAYYQVIRFNRNQVANPSDYQNAVRMLRAPQFPPVPRFHNVVNYVSKHGSASETMEMVDAMLTKLESGKTWDDRLGYRFETAINNLGTATQRLPDEALKPYFERHRDLAMDQQVQQHSFVFVSKMHVYGEKSAPVLLSAMKRGLEGGEHFYRENKFQHPYIGGLIGLCKGGEKLASALPELLQMAQAGKLPNHASYGDLLASTLIRLGADRNDVWDIYSAWEPERRTADRFDRLIARANNTRPDCTY